MRAILAALLLSLSLLTACSRDAADAEGAATDADAIRMPSVTVSGDDSAVDELTWRAPEVVLASDGAAEAHEQHKRYAFSEGSRSGAGSAPSPRSRHVCARWAPWQARHSPFALDVRPIGAAYTSSLNEAKEVESP